MNSLMKEKTIKNVRFKLINSKKINQFGFKMKKIIIIKPSLLIIKDLKKKK